MHLWNTQSDYSLLYDYSTLWKTVLDQPGCVRCTPVHDGSVFVVDSVAFGCWIQPHWHRTTAVATWCWRTCKRQRVNVYCYICFRMCCDPSQCFTGWVASDIQYVCILESKCLIVSCLSNETFVMYSGEITHMSACYIYENEQVYSCGVNWIECCNAVGHSTSV